MSESTSTTARAGRALDWLLADPRAAWALALLFALVGIEAVLAGRVIQDEGLVTWYFASLVGHDPIAALFFQKLRPAVALPYALIAPLGFRAFAIAHTLVGALAIPLLAATCARLGQRRPNVPALLYASSPLVLATAPGGHTNLDATVGLVIALWLLIVRGRSLAAGAVLGALLLIRSEIAVFVLAIVAERALARDYRVALGVALVPAGYALAGIPYHRDLLWVLHYPPAMSQPVPDAAWFGNQDWLADLVRLGDAMFVLCPAWLLVLLLRPAALRAHERGLAIALALFVAAIRGFPLLGLFNFDTSPRYLLVGLPALVVLIGRQVDDAVDGRDGGWPSVVTLALATGFGLLTASRAFDDVVLLGVAVAAVSLALIRLARPRVALLAWLLPLLASAPVWPARTELYTPEEKFAKIAQAFAPALPEAADAGLPIVTNVTTAQAWLTHHALIDEARTPVHYIMQRNMVYELDELLHAEVGQREAIYAGLERTFYGRPVPAAALTPAAWPAGTLVLLELDEDLEQAIDVARWLAALDVLAREDGWIVGRIAAPGPEVGG